MTDDDVRAVRMAAILAATVAYAGKEYGAGAIIATAVRFADYIIHGEST